MSIAARRSALSPDGQALLVATAIDMEFHHQFMVGLRRALWMIMGAAGLLTLAAAWLGLRQGLAPLQRLSERIRDIRSESLGPAGSCGRPGRAGHAADQPHHPYPGRSWIRPYIPGVP